MIRIFNLINGEQIIGEVDDLSDNFKLINPFYIVEDVNDFGLRGSKLTNMLTFSSSDYIMLELKHVIYHFPVTETMEKYYRELIRITDKQLIDNKINESLFEMKQYEDRYEKLMQMVKPKKSDLN